MKRRAFLLAVAAAAVVLPAFAQGKPMKIGVIGSGRIGSTHRRPVGEGGPRSDVLRPRRRAGEARDRRPRARRGRAPAAWRRPRRSATRS